jgi:hypothetical protein
MSRDSFDVLNSACLLLSGHRLRPVEWFGGCPIWRLESNAFFCRQNLPQSRTDTDYEIHSLEKQKAPVCLGTQGFCCRGLKRHFMSIIGLISTFPEDCSR